jgi:hypothetical protein
MDPEELDTKSLVLLLAGQLRERIRSNPVSSLAGAATVGYMLGWSMPTPMYRLVASMGLRAIVSQVVGNLVAAFQDQGLGLFLDDDDDMDLESGSAGASRSSEPRSSDPTSSYVA